MHCVSIPQWHEESYDPSDLVSLSDISAMAPHLGTAALRSYATRRRTNKRYGVMPEPVCRISNRRLWLRTDVESWLVLYIPQWQHSRDTIKGARRANMGSWPTTHV